jgi:inner membrane protein involved in colicin E2 resistance
MQSTGERYVFEFSSYKLQRLFISLNPISSSIQPLIISLLVVHVLLYILIFSTRRNSNAQIILLVLLSAVVYSGKHLNAYLGSNWKELGFTQNYFDPRGIFFSLMVSTPILILLGSMMIYALLQAMDLLVKVKRAEFKQHYKNNRNENLTEKPEEEEIKPVEGKKKGSRSRSVKKN